MVTEVCVNSKLGGNVSSFVSHYFYQILTNLPSYHKKNYEEALHEAFLKCDEILKLENVNEILKHYEKNNEVMSQEISFKYHSSGSKIKSPIKSDKSKSDFSELNLDLSHSSSNSSNQNHSSILSKRKINQSTISSQQNDYCVYSFGGVIIDQSNQTINSNLISNIMGTTANVIYIKSGYIYMANVGDSISVLYKSGTAIKLSTEHKPNLHSEKARIENSGFRILNNRIDGKLNLSRAIGLFF